MDSQNNSDSYQTKYNKYKNKYLSLKKLTESQSGGASLTEITNPMPSLEMHNSIIKLIQELKKGTDEIITKVDKLNDDLKGINLQSDKLNKTIDSKDMKGRKKLKQILDNINDLEESSANSELFMRTGISNLKKMIPTNQQTAGSKEQNDGLVFIHKAIERSINDNEEIKDKLQALEYGLEDINLNYTTNQIDLKHKKRITKLGQIITGLSNLQTRDAKSGLFLRQSIADLKKMLK